MLKSLGFFIALGAAFFIGWGAMNDVLVRRTRPVPTVPPPSIPDAPTS